MNLKAPSLKICLALFSTVLCLALILSVVEQSASIGLWLPVMLVLGATAGPWMGIYFPMPLIIKVAYIGSFILCIAFIWIGIKKRRSTTGQVLVYFGVVFWTLLGTFGLGTGT